MMCALTSKLKRAGAPGNVLLAKDEANLSRRSVVNISQLVTIDKSDLVKKIGALSPRRLEEILEGVHLLIEPREIE